MNNAGIIYKYIYRRPIASFIILLLTILSFNATENYSNASSPSGIEILSNQSQDGIGDEIRSCSSTINLHLLVRGKVKVKIFFKKYFNQSLQFINSFFAYKSVCYALQVRNALKPEYYSFLFRYKPF